MMDFPSKDIVERVRARYPKGTKVELVSMNDVCANIPVGTKGVVSGVDDIGTIFVDWETGSHLGIVYGEDRCRKIEG